MLHKMRRENPGKEFIPAAEHAVCHYMKLNTLEKVVLSLERMQYEVRVPEAIRERALLPIERMIEVSAHGRP